MKKIIVLLVVMIFAFSAVVVKAATPIRVLGGNPWLGEIRSDKDLIKKIKKERQDIARFIRYDLMEASGLQISNSDSLTIVDAMVREGFVGITIPDGTEFLSMGWKKSGSLMRTANPVLMTGKTQEAYLFFGQIGLAEIKYVFLQRCGNLCLYHIQQISAEAVPVPVAEPVQVSQQPQESRGSVVATRIINIALSLPPPPPPQRSYHHERSYRGGEYWWTRSSGRCSTGWWAQPRQPYPRHHSQWGVHTR